MKVLFEITVQVFACLLLVNLSSGSDELDKFRDQERPDDCTDNFPEGSPIECSEDSEVLMRSVELLRCLPNIGPENEEIK